MTDRTVRALAQNRALNSIFRWASDFLLRVEASRGISRTEPNNFHTPRGHSGSTLKAKTPLVRIFDTTFHPLDFNPTLVSPDSPKKRGRFSASQTDEVAYMYVAAGKHGLRTALWEILEFEGIDLESKDFLLPKRMVDKYAIAELETTRRVYVVNIRNQDDLIHFLAKLEVIRGGDYRVTRAWARYIRRVVGKQIDGLRYHSVRAGYDNAVVLYEDRAKALEDPRRSARMVRRVAPIARFSDSAVRRRIADTLRLDKVGI